MSPYMYHTGILSCIYIYTYMTVYILTYICTWRTHMSVLSVTYRWAYMYVHVSVYVYIYDVFTDDIYDVSVSICILCDIHIGLTYILTETHDWYTSSHIWHTDRYTPICICIHTPIYVHIHMSTHLHTVYPDCHV